MGAAHAEAQAYRRTHGSNPHKRAALALPRAQAEKYWNGLRGIMGIAFLTSCTQVFWFRETYGWLGPWGL